MKILCRIKCKLTSFPGPAQLPVTCSDGELGGAWERGLSEPCSHPKMEETSHRRCLSGDWNEWSFEAKGGRDVAEREREREREERNRNAAYHNVMMWKFDERLKWLFLHIRHHEMC